MTPTSELDAGARAVWVVDPEGRNVVVHETGRSAVILHDADILRGGEAVPGFELPVRAIFSH